MKGGTVSAGEIRRGRQPILDRRKEATGKANSLPPSISIEMQEGDARGK